MGSQLKGGKKMPASEYSSKQKKLARVAVPRNKITRTDLKKLMKKRKQKKKKSSRGRKKA